LVLEQLEARCLPTGGFSLNQNLVIQLYQDVLARTPDSAGLNYWSSALDQGATRSEVAGQLLQTNEAQSHLLDKLYESELGRQADAVGKSTFLPLLAQGQELLVQARLFGSAEYSSHNHVSGLSDYLAHLYADALGRPADAPAAAYFGGSQFSGDRTAIALAVLGSPEATDLLIEKEYRHLLEREPDSAGAKHWADALTQGANPLTLGQSLLGSDEYFNSPHANNDAVTTAAGTSVNLNVAANDQRLFGRSVEVALEQNPAHGSAAVRDDGSIIYIPAAGFTGVDILAYLVQTDAGISNLGIVTITVEAA
jgi:hypothetical protein